MAAVGTATSVRPFCIWGSSWCNLWAKDKSRHCPSSWPFPDYQLFTVFQLQAILHNHPFTNFQFNYLIENFYCLRIFNNPDQELFALIFQWPQHFSVSASLDPFTNNPEVNDAWSSPRNLYSCRTCASSKSYPLLDRRYPGPFSLSFIRIFPNRRKDYSNIRWDFWSLCRTWLARFLCRTCKISAPACAVLRTFSYRRRSPVTFCVRLAHREVFCRDPCRLYLLYYYDWSLIKY